MRRADQGHSYPVCCNTVGNKCNKSPSASAKHSPRDVTTLSASHRKVLLPFTKAECDLRDDDDEDDYKDETLVGLKSSLRVCLPEVEADE